MDNRLFLPSLHTTAGGGGMLRDHEPPSTTHLLPLSARTDKSTLTINSTLSVPLTSTTIPSSAKSGGYQASSHHQSRLTPWSSSYFPLSLFSSTSTDSMRSELLSRSGLSSAGKQREPYNDYLLLFDKSSGSANVHYLLIDTGSRRPPKLLPKLSSCLMTKVKDIVGYRVVVSHNLLYVIGGRHVQSRSLLSHCYRYDPDNHSWVRLSSMLRPRIRFTATVLRGCIYVCGGETRDGKITSSVECYNLLLDTWTDVASMPTSRADHAASVAAGGIYVSGGTSEKRGGSTVFWHYDPQLDEWSEASGHARLPSLRACHVTATYKDDIYLVSGLTIKREKKKYHETETTHCSCFRHSNCNIGAHILGRWDRDLQSLTQARAHAGAAVIGHYMYIIGGTSHATGKPETLVEYYNLRRNTWCTAFTLSQPLADVDCAVLRVPHHNAHFSHLGLAMNEKWILW